MLDNPLPLPIDVTPIKDIFGSLTAALTTVYPRVFGFVSQMPMFSTPIVGQMIKFVMIASLSVFALPMAWLLKSMLDDPIQMAFFTVKEYLIGYTLGYIAGMPMDLLESTGVFIDNQRGANVQVINPTASSDASVLGTVLQQSFTVYVLQTGLFMMIMSLFYYSFVAWPMTDFVPKIFYNGDYDKVIRYFIGLFYYGLLFACPILIILGLIEAGFAILARWAPMVPAYSSAIPIKTMTAVFMMVMMLPTYMYFGDGLMRKALSFLNYILDVK